MDHDELIEQVLATWRRHDEILLYLLDQVPADGLSAVPAGSRGRDVARQFAHLDRVRRAWLTRGLTQSGKAVEAFLAAALAGEARPRMFGRQAVRWLGYLIAHESHHRGQIMLALKQSGQKLPAKVALDGLWGRWIFGR